MPPTHALRLVIQMPALNAMKYKIRPLQSITCLFIYTLAAETYPFS